MKNNQENSVGNQIIDTSKSAKIDFRLPIVMKDMIVSTAKEKGIKVSQFIKHLIEKFYEEQAKQDRLAMEADQGHVLERDDQRQAPEDQRNDTQQIVMRDRQAVGRVENRFQGVQRTGADIAVNDADGSQCQADQAAFFVFRRQDCTRFCFVASHNMIGISK